MPEVRVLHVHSGNMLGGVETVLQTLATHRDLAPELDQHFALAFEGAFSACLAASGAPTWQLGAVRTSRPWTVRRGRRALRSLIAELEPAVVVCHAPWAQAIFGPAVRAAGVRLVFWQHGPLAGHHWLERWARRTRPDLAIANSRFTAATTRALFPDITPLLLHYPVAPRGAARGREDVRREVGAAPEATVVIQVSRMEPWKGQRLLIEALARLADVPDWECWQVGGAQRPEEERYLDGLRTLAGRLGVAGRIRFLGQRSDVPDLLSAADIFSQPNAGPEPFGITFIEALYAGLPVVATRMGGAEEIVTPSCGVLVSPGDVEGLATVLRELIGEPERRSVLARAAPHRAAELCDPATQTARLQEALLDAAGRSATLTAIRR